MPNVKKLDKLFGKLDTCLDVLASCWDETDTEVNVKGSIKVVDQIEKHCVALRAELNK